MQNAQIEGVYQECVEPEFWHIQSELFKKAIDQHKWYMSEHANPPHDVGWDVAQADFTKIYLKGFGAGFRVFYCGLMCPKRLICTIGRAYIIGI